MTVSGVRLILAVLSIGIRCPSLTIPATLTNAMFSEKLVEVQKRPSSNCS
jgi:hypothetical protein